MSVMAEVSHKLSSLTASPEMEKIGRVFTIFGRGEKFLEDILKVRRGFEKFGFQICQMGFKNYIFF